MTASLSKEWTSPDQWTFTAGKSQVSVPVRSRLIVNTAEAAIDAAIAGVGVTRVLSYQAEAALRAGVLLRMLRRFEPAPMPISLVHAGQGRPAAEAARVPRFRCAAPEGPARSRLGRVLISSQIDPRSTTGALRT
jgi:DNA-binding transcriptional LysR family regulator